MEDETGRDRVRALFKRRPGDDVVLEEVREFQVTVLVATFTGFLLGGLVGARYAGDKFVAISHSAKFSSTMQAQRELHSASLLGFIRNGCRWGWKLGVFSGVFSGTNIVMSTYRDKSDALNYITAGAVSGCLFRLPSGVKPAIGGMVLGTLLSVPVGILMHGLERGLVSQEKRGAIRKEKESRLKSTAELIKDLEQELEAPGSAPLHSMYTTEHQTTDNGQSSSS